MSDSSIDRFIYHLDSKFKERQFYTISELKEIGVFGSLGSARKALKDGKLPYFKISRRRFLVARQDFIDFLLRQKNSLEQ